jgi:hypothetical protein
MSCLKPNCTNPKIPRGKYCETHRSAKHTKGKVCGGGSICKHDKRRIRCKECTGENIVYLKKVMVLFLSITKDEYIVTRFKLKLKELYSPIISLFQKIIFGNLFFSRIFLESISIKIFLFRKVFRKI